MKKKGLVESIELVELYLEPVLVYLRVRVWVWVRMVQRGLYERLNSGIGRTRRDLSGTSVSLLGIIIYTNLYRKNRVFWVI